MPKQQDIICIMCPMGCLMTVTTDDDDNATAVANNLCKEGKAYAAAECRFPGRVLTTTVLTEGSPRRLLPARTDRPIPKGRLLEAVRYLSGLRVKSPVEVGQVIAADVLGTGVNLIATDKMP
jgi:CxxC motif-containing protein